MCTSPTTKSTCRYREIVISDVDDNVVFLRDFGFVFDKLEKLSVFNERCGVGHSVKDRFCSNWPVTAELNGTYRRTACQVKFTST